MTPSEIKECIARIKENMVEEKALINTYRRYRDEENYSERTAKQRKIIAEAIESLTLIQREYDDSPDKIAKIEQKMKRENKRLVVLNNYEKIERLKKAVGKLSEIRKLEKMECQEDTQEPETATCGDLDKI